MSFIAAPAFLFLDRILGAELSAICRAAARKIVQCTFAVNNPVKGHPGGGILAGIGHRRVGGVARAALLRHGLS
jgi:hypothetical protein